MEDTHTDTYDNMAPEFMDGYDSASYEKQEIIDELENEITYLKNLIVKMSYDIYYEDGSKMDISIKKITKTK
tara:strand:- start:783 stop:998 length:216 start_codon:yes stop_codon:yes gene_type:complete